MASHFIRGKDIREQIRLSKLTWCSDLRKPEYGHFHGVIKGPRPTRSETADAKFRFEKRHGRAPKDGEVVYRRPCRDWIPADVSTSSLRFAPFRHIVMKGKVPVEVLRSFWEGSIQSGRFRMDHGQITDALAEQILVMAHKYSTKANWAGYTWRQDMCSAAIATLFEKGLKFDETKSSNVFAYWTTCMKNAFLNTNDKEKRSMKIKAAAVMEVLPHVEATEAPVSDVVRDQLERMLGNPGLVTEEAPAEDPKFRRTRLEDDRPLMVGNRKFWSLAEAAAETGGTMAEIREALLSKSKKFRGQEVVYAEDESFG